MGPGVYCCVKAKPLDLTTVPREWKMREFMRDGGGVSVYDLHPHRRPVWEHIDYYCKHGLEGQLLPLVPGGKQPVLGVRFKMHLPFVRADFGRTKMTRDRLQDYYLDQGWRNLGLRTGEQSGIVVIDFDRPKSGDTEALLRFENVMERVRRGRPLPGIGPTDTSCYETAHGVQLLYGRTCPLRSIAGVTLRELRLAVDVKAEGGMVVVPPSVTGSQRRHFLRDLDCLKPLLQDTEIVRMTLRDEGVSAPDTGRRTVRPLPKFYVKDYLCAKAIAEMGIPDHKRDIILFMLYNVLLLAGNTPEHAQRVVGAVNARHSKPMPDGELKKCFGKYNYGCEGIRQMLPHIEVVCARCNRKERADRKVMDMIDTLDLRKIARAKVSKTGLMAYLLGGSGQSLTRREMADCLGISERGLYGELRRLREETGLKVSSRT